MVEIYWSKSKNIETQNGLYGPHEHVLQDGFFLIDLMYTKLSYNCPHTFPHSRYLNVKRTYSGPLCKETTFEKCEYN